MPNPPSMFDSPRPASTAAPADNYIQPTLSHGLRIWWAFYWRTLLATILLVAAVAKILPLVAEAPAARLILRYGVYFFYYSAAFFMIAFILRKNFRDFRIALLSHRGGDGAQPLPPNFQRVARVWWTFSWRSLLYRLIATFVISFPLGWIVGFIAHFLPGRASVALLNFAVQVLIDAAVGMFVIYSSILDEDISDFRVALIPSTPSPISEVPTPAPAAS
ncbi:MAG: hypothetical protein WCA15_15905 [Candidatus Acidiferrales bacterium]